MLLEQDGNIVLHPSILKRKQATCPCTPHALVDMVEITQTSGERVCEHFQFVHGIATSRASAHCSPWSVWWNHVPPCLFVCHDLPWCVLLIPEKVNERLGFTRRFQSCFFDAMEALSVDHDPEESEAMVHRSGGVGFPAEFRNNRWRISLTKHRRLRWLAFAFLVLASVLAGMFICTATHRLDTNGDVQRKQTWGTHYDYLGRPRLSVSARGAAAADTGTCSEVARNVMKDGGNAVDAAVAGAFCQGVVNPHSSGVGGGTIMVIRMADGRAQVVDAREVAPKNAYETMFPSTNHDDRPSVNGGLAIAVPLEMLGLREAWKRYGRAEWKTLVSPAAELAKGFKVHPLLSQMIKLSLPMLKQFPTLMKIYAPKGRAPEPGEECCRRPEFARFLRRVAEEGPEFMYQEKMAATLVKEINAAGGNFTIDDFLQAKPTVRKPLQTTINGLDFFGAPPPSAGVAVLSALHLLSYLKQPPITLGLQFYHYLVESMRHVFAMRLTLGDPAFVPNANEIAKKMVDEEYMMSLFNTIKPETTLPLTDYGGEYNPIKLNGNGGYVPDDHGTSHMSILDADGNAVALTTTVNTGFGSKVVSPSTGIIFNSEMDDFSIPGKSNVYELAPSKPNFIRPGKKPLSSMSPTIVVNPRTGKVRAVVGASGGPRIITAVLQALARHLFLGKPVVDSVFEPRLHDQLLPERLGIEDWDLPWSGTQLNVSEPMRNYLAGLGHKLMPLGLESFSVCQMIAVVPETGLVEAVSDLRKDGAPSGY